MKLVDEDQVSLIDDAETFAAAHSLLPGRTGQAASWVGPYSPKSNNKEYDNYAAWNRSHYDIYLKFIEDGMDKPGDVLEIGSASGARSVLLARYGCKVTGLELEDKRREFAEKYNAHPSVTYLAGTFPADAPAGPYDYIFCVSVLYQRAAEPATIVSAARSMLKPGGKLFIYDRPENIPADHQEIWRYNGHLLVSMGPN